jgi:cyclic beta-1,2-glucan synthetase
MSNHRRLLDTVLARAAKARRSLTELTLPFQTTACISQTPPARLNEGPRSVELFGPEQLAKQARLIAAGHVLTEDRCAERLLPRLQQDERVIADTYALLADAAAHGRRLAPASEWLLDNFYLIEEQVALSRRHLPRGYSRELPRLAHGPGAGCPRVYGLAVEFVAHTDGRFDELSLSGYIRAYQEVSVLRLGELWAVPIMLRLALVGNVRRIAERLAAARQQRDAAGEWAARFLDVAQHQPKHIIVALADLLKTDPHLSRPFVIELATRLQGQHSSLGLVLQWIEQELSESGRSLEQVLLSEGQDAACDQVSISNSITGLRALSSVDWRVFVEAHSAVEPCLRRDPAAVYAAMDFHTRDRYRHVVERLSRHSRCTEPQVAQEAVIIAQEASAHSDPARRHVGFYLIGSGLALLEARIGHRAPWAEAVRLRCHRAAGWLYVGATVVMTGLLAVIALAWLPPQSAEAWALGLAGAMVLLLASQAAMNLVNAFVTALVAPQSLPRMDYSQGIPTERRTVVCVPTLLTSTDAVCELVEDLEVRYLANRDPNLAFVLLTDWRDAATEQQLEDEPLLRAAAEGVRNLNVKYGDVGGVFVLLHRPRRWNQAEGVWMGYERKRGKITDLNTLLLTGDRTAFSAIEGDIARLQGARYVIVLDTDTQFPPESAWKLVGTMAHPLNEARVDPTTRRTDRGYGLLQPRVSVFAGRSRFARLFAGESGIDPYTRQVSNVYQDLFAESSFIGKGIIDIRAFEACLHERFPENTVLSHDLLEGCYARCGFVGDVEFIEEHPARYTADIGRRHRWTRGDWQVLGWLWRRSPIPGGRERNPLSALSRGKILDNLRRSLQAPAALVLLALGWLVLPMPGAWLPVVAGLLLLPPLVRSLHSLLNKSQEVGMRLHLILQMPKQAAQFAQAALALVFLPFEAVIFTSAIVTVFWRKLVTGRRLLQWQTAAVSDGAARAGVWGVCRTMWVAPTLAAVLIGAIAFLRPEALPVALPVLLCWFFSPVLAWWISCPLTASTRPLDRDQAAFLRELARRTWSYYERFTGEQSHWLPPDNFQEKPNGVIAARTSPTNIGMAAASALAAWDFGYITSAALLERIGKLCDTLDRLERHRGHYLNWYDTGTLLSLPPRYVSTVDSGNLAALLVVSSQGLREMQHGPIVSLQWLHGIRDTARVLRAVNLEHQQRAIAATPNAAQLRLERAMDTILIGPESSPSPPLAVAVALLERFVVTLRPVYETVDELPDEARWWVHAICKQCADLRAELEHFAPWRAPSEADLIALSQAMLQSGATATEIQAIVKQLREVPHLSEVAELHERLRAWLNQAVPANEANGWLGELRRFAPIASERARRRTEELSTLEARARDLGTMDFSFLFDTKRKLFSIGFQVDERRLDPSYYDLLASEARLASYVAVAQHQVPYEHWFLLGRSLTPVNGSAALVSWSGSMFEYLMPLLIMPTYEGTLLDQTYAAAVASQIEFGRANGVPWGVSESGYNLVDAQLNYQYRAFGVPALGLKRGLADDLVIAPYASAMAVMVRPHAAVKNLQVMERAGFVGPCGLYEAVDYTPRRLPDGQSHVVVRSYMAHHSGMTLLALAYAILDRPMQRRFLAEPEFRAMLLLLQELIPSVEPSIAVTKPLARISDGELSADQERPATRVYNNPATSCPAVGLLSNGRYHVMLTNAGSGSSRWNDLAITRWRADRTQDQWGQFCYVRDADRNRVWSVAHQPTGQVADSYAATFSQGKIEFHRVDEQIETHTQISVSAEDDVEVRRVTVRNTSRLQRSIELTTYGEVVLAPPANDAAHRAFSNLFVETELLPESAAILCTRRARAAGEKPPWMFHMATGDVTWGAPSFETDRAVFIGRGRSPRDPAALNQPGALLGNAGAVLDPIVSIRRIVELEPGQSADLIIVTGAAANRAGAIALIEKYRDQHVSDRAFETAWTHNQVLLQQIGATPSDAAMFNRLSATMIFADAAMRAAPAVVARNRRGQSSLWGHSISGDLPILLLTVSDVAGLDLVTKVVQAHTWWRAKGLRVDWVILVEESTGYRQNLIDRVVAQLGTGAEASYLDKPGGVFVRNADNLPEEDRVLLQAVAALTLSDRAGNLYEQANRPPRPHMSIPAIKLNPSSEDEIAGDLPQRDLWSFNGTGGFTTDGREYVIRLDPGCVTPAPWSNVIANAVFGSVVTESGGGYTWSENAHEFRLTPWHNDPVCDTSGEAFYIRDESSGRFWSPTALPARGQGPYVCRHGQGYSVFEHDEAGIFTEATHYVAIDAPVKFVVIKLRNHSGRSRRLSVTGYFEWVLGEHREKSAMHVVTRLDPRTGALLATNAYNHEFGDRVAFAHCYPNDRTFTGDRAEFIGRNGTLAAPAAMRRQRLSNRVGATLDPCAALQCVIEIPDGQEREVVFMLGAGNSDHEAQAVLYRFGGPHAAREALDAVWEQWKRLLGAVYVETPDPALNMMVNQWALYQTIACRIWGRSGFYQSGGAFGFRDQLQDAMALLHAAPWLLREQLLRCASRQFREGDVQHWWHPPLGRGVRTHFSDDYLWLPHAACRYVLGTGDTGVLDEAVPFLDGRAVKPDEEAYYDLPRTTDERASLYEHCARSIRRALTRLGSHGLPLIGCGDWNDGMNKIGEQGRGESVWLAFFLFDLLTEFPKLAMLRQDTVLANECRAAADRLRTSIEANGWDGQWYRRAYFDDGTPLGSAENDECQIDSISQSWAVLSKAANPQRSRQAMDAVARRLVRDDLRLIQLFDPPFDTTKLDPGYIKGYVPGVRENGAQYTHAAIWTAMAFGAMGNAKEAWRCFSYLCPAHHARSPAEVGQYKVEPYVVPADVYTNPRHAGRGGWTWYTGSAAWMYRLMLETLLGLRLEVDKLSFTPVLPEDWKEYRIHYRYRETRYHINFVVLGPQSGNVRRVIVDGQVQDDKFIHLHDDGKDHQAEVELG